MAVPGTSVEDRLRGDGIVEVDRTAALRATIDACMQTGVPPARGTSRNSLR